MFRQTSLAVVRLNCQVVRTGPIYGNVAFILSLEHLYFEMLHCAVQVRNIKRRGNDCYQISFCVQQLSEVFNRI